MEGFLEECVRVLRRFKQMILQGPPGTGKTRAAKLVVAEMLEVDGEKIDSPEYRGKRWDIVQFHPSYGYEDFVRGVRVKTENGNAIYETVDRHFGVMAKRAFDNPGDKHFLIIDEINRANVAAVLGELIYGLEYRGDKITTQYAVGENDFSLVAPKNLFVIGTMNTADRTIGHIDYAVRRRFAFRTLLPDRAVVENNQARHRLCRCSTKCQRFSTKRMAACRTILTRTMSPSVIRIFLRTTTTHCATKCFFRSFRF